jgi:probable phosphoglycerate mutase
MALTKFDIVLCSPLDRARQTAAAFGVFEIDHDLIEIDLGSWDGLTTHDVLKNYRDDFDQVIADVEVRFGGSGENRAEIAARFYAAIDRVFAALGPGGRAAIVTHGGVLDVLTDRIFGRDKLGRRLGSFTSNTGITRLVERFGHRRLTSFNDTGHLGPRPAVVERARSAGLPVLALIRHGRTTANVERRWQGHSDWGLDDVGYRQAKALAAWYGPIDRVVSSPLGRALQTATALHPTPETFDGLVELGFGKWEGLTFDEIRRDWPELLERIFRDRLDLPRGETGETWAQLGRRVREAMFAIAPQPGELTAVVTHGAAIRAYLADLVDGGWSEAAALETPANSSVTHLIMHKQGPVVADYSSAVHLESLEDQ